MATIEPKLRKLPVDHPRVSGFARSLNPNAAVQEVPLVPVGELRPKGNCYWNVEARVLKDGGEAVYGWLMLYWPPYFVEAMHHAVWRDGAGNLFDLTEPPYGDEVPMSSTFLPASNIPIQLDRLPHIQSRHFYLRDDRYARAFIEAYRAKNVVEATFATLLFNGGYRCETQRAIAAGRRPTGFAFDPLTINKLERQTEIIERARVRLGDAIQSLLTRDARVGNAS